MAFECEICGKSKITGHNVSHANNRTKRVWRPNLQRVRVQTKGGRQKIMICTRCLRSGRTLSLG
ncbi:MAG: 50S ribosomal protein L28 [Deltaproteobacteria bacterium]|nr:50S ribosomal protein L28 [Deltaproteobacteria bacterium]MBW2306063.1 50S ribosomal protein L28 [Deltaproteobacteria bacterium]